MGTERPAACFQKGKDFYWRGDGAFVKTDLFKSNKSQSSMALSEVAAGTGARYLVSSNSDQELSRKREREREKDDYFLSPDTLLIQVPTGVRIPSILAD